MIKNNYTASVRVEGILFAILLIVALLALMLLPAHGATTSNVKKNATGYVAYVGNPYTYKEATVTAVAYVGSKNHTGIVVRLQPRGTYSLFTEDILFCGAPVEMFIGKQNPMVLTYETVAHSSVEEIGCHRLVSVDEVKVTKGDWQ